MTRITYTPEERKARMDTAHAELTARSRRSLSSDDWRAFSSSLASCTPRRAKSHVALSQAMLRGWDDLGHVAGFRLG